MLSFSLLCQLSTERLSMATTAVTAVAPMPPLGPRRSGRTTVAAAPPYLATYPALGDAPLSLVKDATKGWCVYADAAIPKGAFVLEYAGRLLTHAESLAVEASYADMEEEDPGSYMFWFSHNNATYCIDATLPPGTVNDPPDMRWGLGRYLNHSRTPNLYVTLKTGNAAGAPQTSEHTTPRLCFFARHTIAAGTELTFNYGDRSRESRENFAWL